jgi:pyrroloquinoline-quinone synthase
MVKTVPLIVENTLKNNSNPRYEGMIKEALEDENEHIDPWIKFASSLDVNNEDLKNYSPDPATNRALDSLLKLSRNSFIEGAAAMYAFEKELPKMSETKSAGLREFYGLHDESSHQYFDIHREVDIYHARMWENILNDCSEEMHEKVLNATRISLKAQNDLLDAVQQKFVDKISYPSSQ